MHVMYVFISVLACPITCEAPDSASTLWCNVMYGNRIPKSWCWIRRLMCNNDLWGWRNACVCVWILSIGLCDLKRGARQMEEWGQNVWILSGRLLLSLCLLSWLVFETVCHATTPPQHQHQHQHQHPQHQISNLTVWWKFRPLKTWWVIKSNSTPPAYSVYSTAKLWRTFCLRPMIWITNGDVGRSRRKSKLWPEWLASILYFPARRVGF